MNGRGINRHFDSSIFLKNNRVTFRFPTITINQWKSKSRITGNKPNVGKKQDWETKVRWLLFCSLWIINEDNKSLQFWECFPSSNKGFWSLAIIRLNYKWMFHFMQYIREMSSEKEEKFNETTVTGLVYKIKRKSFCLLSFTPDILS